LKEWRKLLIIQGRLQFDLPKFWIWWNYEKIPDEMRYDIKVKKGKIELLFKKKGNNKVLKSWVTIGGKRYEKYSIAISAGYLSEAGVLYKKLFRRIYSKGKIVLEFK